MSTKQQLAAAVEALPDSLTVEEAMARLYRAFKLKRLQTQLAQKLRPLPVLDGHIPDGWKDAICE